MTDEKTRDRILNVAERLFAEQGYATTSIRQITGEARVSLPAVNYHFGSKGELFQEVIARCFAGLDRERIRRLDELEVDAAPGVPAVEDVVRALMQPAMEMARDAQRGPSWLLFIGRIRTEPGDHWRRALAVAEQHRTMLARVVEVLGRALPKVPAPALRLRIFWMICTTANALIDDQTLPLLGAPLRSIHEAPEECLEELVHYVSAGLEDDRRAEPRQKTPAPGRAPGGR